VQYSVEQLGGKDRAFTPKEEISIKEVKENSERMAED
jgi:hypothetical protein